MKRCAVSGGSSAYAAEKARYAFPDQSGSRVLARPAVQESIKRQQAARLNNELLPLALNVLQDVLTSPKATERGKLAASAQVLKHTLGASIDAGEGKEPHEMTIDEIHQRLEALRREAADRAKPVIEGEAESSVFG